MPSRAHSGAALGKSLFLKFPTFLVRPAAEATQNYLVCVVLVRVVCQTEFARDECCRQPASNWSWI